MTVAIQPSGNKASRKHYADTIESPVELSEKRRLLGDQFSILSDAFPTGLVPMWGVTPGQNDANVSKYRKLAVGDTVLFTRDKLVVASGVIAVLLENPALARDLWGVDSRGQTWELMYALEQVTNRSISCDSLRVAIRSKPGDNFMGFRVLSRAKSEAVMELLGYEIPEPQWDIAPGDVLKRTELQSRYGGGPYGGIEPSAKTANILLFTNPYKKSRFGYDFDEEKPDGTMTYTGDGQIGPQHPDQGGNKAILEHQQTRRALRLFEVTPTQSSVRYIGEFELGHPEFEKRTAPDTTGAEREVLVFNLVPVGVTRTVGALDDQPRFGNVARRSAEKGHTFTHSRKVNAGTTFAERQEIKLQSRFEEYLTAAGFDVGSMDIQVANGGAPLKPDLVDFTHHRIIEAKAGTSRLYIREAIGQVLDYAFQVRTIKGEVWIPAILLPGEPTEDLVALIRSLGILLYWETNDGSTSVFHES